MRSRLFAVPLLLGLAAAVSCTDGSASRGLLTEPEDRGTSGLHLRASTVSASTGPAAVTTDKDDYQPGDLVTILGAGFTAGEVVLLHISEEPPNHPDHNFSVTADASGAFIHRQLVMDDDHLGVTFTLTATGQTSGAVATAVFTDAEIVNNVSVSPISRTVTAGGSADYTVIVNFTGTAEVCTAPLSISGLPRGATGTFDPTSVSGAGGATGLESQLTISTTAGGANATPGGTFFFTVTVSATGSGCDGVNRTAAAGLVVESSGTVDDDTPPVVTTVQASPDATDGSVDVQLTGTAADAASNLVSAAYSIDGGGFSPMVPADGTFDDLTEEVTVNISAAIIAGLSEGDHTLCVRATDAVGNTSGDGDACVTLLVDRSAPVMSNLRATPNPVADGSAAVLSAKIADALTNVSRAYYSTDGGSSWTQFPPFTPAVEVNVSTSLSLSAGVHSVCVMGEDAVGNMSSGNDCALLAVYDPSDGFVTGGGWIQSPAGAYYPDPDLTDKANFGFVSKYRKGANVPDGATEFQFQAAGLKFQSTRYDWLVVAGSKAQFKGIGRMNGVDGYGFLLTARDGGKDALDTFRMKIWDANGDVIYDNQLGAPDAGEPTTALGGGSIVIHAR